MMPTWGSKNSSANEVPTYRLVMVGDGGVGKSCLTIQFFQKQFMDWYDPTIEEQYIQHCEVDGRWCKLDVLDTAGQQEFASMLDYHMGTGRGFLLVFSVTELKSFELAQRLYQKILRLKDRDTYPMVFVGNKVDLTGQRVVSEETAKSYAESIGVPYFETSAKEYTNVDEVFFELVREVRKFDYLDENFTPRAAVANGKSDVFAAAAGNSTSTGGSKRKLFKRCDIL